MEASTVLASTAAVAKGATKFARDPSLQTGLSIVGDVATDIAVNVLLNKVGGKLVQKVAKSKLGTRVANSSFAHQMEERFTNAFAHNRTPHPTCVGEPVDVATGKVINGAIDFELPGPLPLVWQRIWYSTSAHEGALGHGWHHAYDEELYVDDELIIVRLADGRYTGNEPLAVEEAVFIREEKLTLTRTRQGYTLHDAAGLTHYFAYAAVSDSYKLVRLAQEAEQAAILFEYNAQGFLASITDSAGRRLSVICDATGRIQNIRAPHPTEARGQVEVVRYEYNSQGHLVQAADALGQAWQFRYQGSLLVQATYKNGLSFYYEYDGSDARARCVRTWGDEGIYSCQLHYDRERPQTTVIDSVGAQRTYLYDPELGVVTQLVDARGGVTRSEYNEHGELTSLTDPLGQQTQHTYDERGNCTATQLPDGAQLQRAYDAHDRLVQLTDAVGGQWHWVHTPEGRLAQRTDPLGRTVRYAYQKGQLTTITNVAGRWTTLSYDAAGNVVEVQTADGQRSRWLYDQWSRVHKTADARGNVQWREHDLLSQVTAVYEPDGNVRRLTYDALGNVTRAQDRHHDVQYAYRGLGRLIRRVEAGTAVEFLHDTEERLRAVVNEHGLTYRFELDGEGDVITEAGFDGLTRRYQRDVGGRVAELLLPTSQRTRYTYDAAGRVTQVEYGDGSAETYAYRADGALLEASNEVTTVTFARDVLGNVTQESQRDYTVTSEYSQLGQRIALRSSLGAQVGYTYNEPGALAEIKAGSWRASFERDAQGLELQRTLSSGVSARWKRDQLGRPTEQRIRVGMGRQTEQVRAYSWQAGDRLTQIEDNKYGLSQFERDAIGNLASVTFGDGTRELRLPDAVGNLFQTSQRQDRQYGPAGQLVSAHGVRYEYDALGNLCAKLTAQGQKWHYAWDVAGQLAEVVRPDGGVVRFTYDALGRRLSKSYRGQVTRWVWDGNKILHEWTTLEATTEAPEEVVTWLFEEDSFAPLGKLHRDKQYSIVTDHLGTPLEMHDERGQTTWAATLSAYGRVRQVVGERERCPFRYQGQYEDAETGLYYNRFRYYDPEMGTYLSQDPIKLAGGSKLYSYVSDPYSLIDPSGLNCETTAKLQAHANEAKAEAVLSPKQQASIQRSRNRAAEAVDDPKAQSYHEMQAAKKQQLYMGTQVDTRFKAKVDADPDLAHLSTTPRGKVGPDVYDPKESKYWDLTTQKDWDKGTHQSKYDEDYGKGTGIFW